MGKETYYKRKRKKAGLASSDMAKELGINYKKYNLIENGVVKMPKNLIDKFNEIVNKGKNENALERLNNEQVVTEFWNEMTTKVDGTFILKEKMKEFNIKTFSELANLLGVSGSNLSHYLNADYEAPYNFKNAMYLFFQDELNIQVPRDKVSPLKGKPSNNRKGRGCKNPELINWYRNTDLIKLANENNLTYEDISNGCGVNLSSVSRAMRKSTETPSQNTLTCLKEYFDKLQINPTIFDDEWTKQPCETVDFNEFAMPTLEKCEETPQKEEQNNTDVYDVIERYHREIDEIDDCLETYEKMLQDLSNRRKVCVEVLKVIDLMI